jgi:hypothetical protein
VGQYNSLDIDSAGKSHVSYYDATNNSIKYALRDGTTWTTQTVTGLGGSSEVSLLTIESSSIQATALKLDSSNIPSIAYYHTGNTELQFAQSSGAGWTISVVDTNGDVGQYVSLDFGVNGKSYMSYFDAGNQDLKVAAGVSPALYLPLVAKETN